MTSNATLHEPDMAGAGSAWRRLCDLSSLPLEQPVECATDLRPVLACRVAERVFALQHLCTHAPSRLCEGFVDGHVLECERHGAQFDLRTGAVLRGPATEPLRVFPVRIEAGQVFVELPDEPYVPPSHPLDDTQASDG
jgi:nitrite reductase/ring-hydroxylating ferredoxin subunit